MNWIKTHKGIVAGVVAVGAAGLIFIAIWFQPQALLIDDVVDETIPPAASAQETTGDAEPDEPTDMETDTDPVEESGAADGEDSVLVTEPATGEEPPEYPLTLSEGEFIDLAHSGSGAAKVIELEDGTRILRLEDLDVDNGPDLRVILSSSELVDDDGAYDDGAFLDLGDLKGNKGNQNYEIPPEIDLDDFATVAIWCRRFNVSFNAAPLTSGI